MAVMLGFYNLFEPRHEKTKSWPMRKQRCTSAQGSTLKGVRDSQIIMLDSLLLLVSSLTDSLNLAGNVMSFSVDFFCLLSLCILSQISEDFKLKAKIDA